MEVWSETKIHMKGRMTMIAVIKEIKIILLKKDILVDFR